MPRFLSLIAALAVIGWPCGTGHGQGPLGADAKWTVAFENWRPLRNPSIGQGHFGAWLDLPGERLLVTVSHDERVSIFDLESGDEEKRIRDQRSRRTWIDPETGGVFDYKLPDHTRIVSDAEFLRASQSGKYSLQQPGVLVDRDGLQAGAADAVVCTSDGLRGLPEELYQDRMELHYFPSLDSYPTEKPAWVFPKAPPQLALVRYIATHDVFVCCGSLSGRANQVVILDRYGHEIGTFEVPGTMLAVDSCGEEDLLLFVGKPPTRSSGNRPGVLCSLPVLPDYSGVGREIPLYPMYGLEARKQTFCHSIGTRHYRLRGLKPGDLCKFFDQVYRRTDYPFFEDLWPLRSTLDRGLAPASVGLLIQTAKQRAVGKLTTPMRLAGLNQLEAWEDRRAYEIVDLKTAPGIGQVLLSRSGEGMLPDLDGFFISDGLLHPTRQVLLAHKVTQEHGEYRLGVKVFRLQAAEK